MGREQPSQKQTIKQIGACLGADSGKAAINASMDQGDSLWVAYGRCPKAIPSGQAFESKTESSVDAIKKNEKGLPTFYQLHFQ